MLTEIRSINCSLAKDLYKSLRKRIKERRVVYSPLLNFLKNPKKSLILIKNWIPLQIKGIKPVFCKRS